MPDPTMTTPSELFTHPRPRCVVTTVYSDPAVSLTVQAWRRNLYSYYLLFRIANQYSLTLNETAVFYFFRRFPDWYIQPPGGWAKHTWNPATDKRVSAQALAAVNAWLAEQEAND
jgi:hypothetical protein